MNSRKIQEVAPRHKFIVFLMAVSMSFLILLQAAWLRSEYRSASSAFRRETNMVFRTTIMQIADSLFIASVINNPDSDTLFHAELTEADTENRMQESPERNEKLQKLSVERAPGKRNVSSEVYSPDSLTYQVRVFRDVNKPNHVGDATEGTRRSRHFRFFSNFRVRGIDPDTIAMLYRNQLHYRLRSLPFEIIQKQVNWMEFDWNRNPRQADDTLRFATAFYPIGPQYMYAADFGNVRGMLFMEILPQTGFSILTTSLIIGLFILTIRYLNAQQRLIMQKNDFIGNMTHELKTPVATVGVALEAMNSFDVLKNPIKAKEYIRMAQHELDRLSLMTDKILKTSIHDYKREIELQKTPVDLCILAQKVFSSFQLVAEKNRTHFEINCVENAWVMGHPEHLLQMIYNIVDNAFKYCDTEASITISVKSHLESVELEVKDNGPGIAQEHHRKVFEKFYRVPSGNIHTVKGYGLGLSYVDGVAKSHGGKVSLSSRPGDGSVFTINLPAIVGHGKN